MQRWMMIALMFLPFLFHGCALSAVMTGSTFYDIYAVGVDERGLYTLAKDKRIKTQIQAAILDDKQTSILDVGVDSFYGKVILVGEYETQKELTRLREIVGGVEGVREVTEHLLPMRQRQQCGRGDDLSLLAKVKTALFEDKKVWGTDVHVYTVQCQVVLGGIVATKMERDRAIALAKGVRGGRMVTSYIRALQ